MSEELNAAADAVDQARKRLIWAMGHVPDDRLTWSPAPTAKNTLQIVSHLVSSNGFFVGALTTGVVNAPPTEETAELGSRQEALDQINATTDALMEAIRGLTEERMAAVIRTPFGESSAAFFLRIAPLHLFGHASQIEYIQSCWGDTDFHWND